MTNFINELESSIFAGFIDINKKSKEAFQPSLILNDRKKQLKVLTYLIKNFLECDEFWLSVAFLRKSGVAVLMNTLDELERKNIPGKILISEYLHFTEPEAIRSIIKFKNLEVRITKETDFHGKEYIFKNKDKYNIIIGSSNLTQNALSTNYEINIKLTANKDSKIVNETINNFNSIFFTSFEVTKEYINEYEKVFLTNQIIINNSSKEIEDKVIEYVPIGMQKKALINIENLRNQNINKALVISATATGKTFLAVFDVKNFKAKKILYVVHRLKIAKKALETFRLVFGNEKSLGIYSGSKRDLNSDFIFSTIQTINNPTHLNNFSKDNFDYIIIDETHRAGAITYQRVLNYFKPKFLLGITATPERTDGYDIYSLFDHNVAYEIRLQKAMDDDLVCPFHYFGITDLSVDGKILDDKSDFKLLVHQERVERIIEQINKYGSDNGINRGLIFCSRKDEAEILSALFNKKGFNTVALTGDSTEEEREEAVELLEEDNLEKKIDYIFSVDIFNEGIDIPKINQIIMLRPTQSSIIFIQQLGRGLRKVIGKEYLTVIDFIGNYQNNYLVPIALFGDNSFNKDKLRKLLSSGSNIIPGASTINFDKIAKEKIFDSINFSNFNQKKDLTESYQLLKYRIGSIPKMVDFQNTASRNPFHFVKYSNSYLNFVNMVENDVHKIPDNFSKVLEYFSKEINNGIRLEESLILKNLLEFHSTSTKEISTYINNNYGYIPSNKTFESAINNINLNFITEKYKKKEFPVSEIYQYNILDIKEGRIYPGRTLQDCFSNNIFKDYFSDSVDYSIEIFKTNFKKQDFVDGFIRYEKYSRKDTLRILNWPKNTSSTVYGYKTSPDESNCPIFVDYHKKEDIAETVKYEDKFLNPSQINTMSKSRRYLNSPDVQYFLNSPKDSTRLPLFIKKSNDEGKEFYFIGDMKPISNSFAETEMSAGDDSNVSVVSMKFDLDKPVIEDIYNYIIDKD